MSVFVRPECTILSDFFARKRLDSEMLCNYCEKAGKIGNADVQNTLYNLDTTKAKTKKEREEQ